MFVGAGGGALHLLQKSGIKEAKGFGGFPVSGEFLRTANPTLTAAHHAKVYGFPPLGAPPMSAPHLDTRIIGGKPWLLFGPFAGWSPNSSSRATSATCRFGQADQPRADARRRH